MKERQWQNIEKECFEYFNENFSIYVKDISPMGDSDSTNADIMVTKNNGEIIWVEIKSENAQCGQFVLLPKNGQFEYSRRNKSEKCVYSREIIKAMNNQFENFIKAGTKGVDIGIDESVYVDWIKWYYSSKGVKLMITKSNNEFIIFPLDKLEDYYKVEGTYRIKKSGSRNVPKSKSGKCFI